MKTISIYHENNLQSKQLYWSSFNESGIQKLSLITWTKQEKGPRTLVMKSFTIATCQSVLRHNFCLTSNWKTVQPSVIKLFGPFFCFQRLSSAMVQTSKTDHFFKLAPFWSPLTDLIDFGMAGKLLTSATRRCSPFVDSVSRIWIKPKKITDWLLGSNGYNLWPISTAASTTNGRPQRSQPPFRADVLGQFSLP